jgi:hypothetical protein
MASTREELLDYLETYVKSNSSPSLTRGSDIRAFMELIIAAVVNILDDKDQVNGYLGLDDSGFANIEKITRTTPDGSFLKDDGTWAKAITALLDGLSTTPGQVSATDSILQAIGKLQGNGAYATEITAAAHPMERDKQYIANNAGRLDFTLPAAADVGSRLRIHGKGVGGWRISQSAGQTIRSSTGPTTPGVGGRVDSLNQYDSVELVCIVANTDWLIVGNNGLTIV